MENVTSISESSTEDTMNKSKSSKPTRPLSGYNLFFRVERARIVNGDDEDQLSPNDIIRLLQYTSQKKDTKRKHKKTHGKIAFVELARVIADRWNKLDDQIKDTFEKIAAQKKIEYKKQLKAWKSGKKFDKSSAGTTSVLDSMIMNGQLKGLFDRTSAPAEKPSFFAKTMLVPRLQDHIDEKYILAGNTLNPSDFSDFERKYELNEKASQHHSLGLPELTSGIDNCNQLSSPMAPSSSSMLKNSSLVLRNEGYCLVDIPNNSDLLCNKTTDLDNYLNNCSSTTLNRQMSLMHSHTGQCVAENAYSNECIAAYEHKFASLSSLQSWTSTKNKSSTVHFKWLPGMKSTSLLESMVSSLSESSTSSTLRNLLSRHQPQNFQQQLSQNTSSYPFENDYCSVDAVPITLTPDNLNQSAMQGIDYEIYNSFNKKLADMLEPRPISPHDNLEQQQDSMPHPLPTHAWKF